MRETLFSRNRLVAALLACVMTIGLLPTALAAESTEDTSIPYSVTVRETIEHGSVTVSAQEAATGETVTVTAVPDEGYTLTQVGYWTVNAEGKVGRLVEVTTDGTGAYAFTMPESNVVVGAAFQDSSKPVLVSKLNSNKIVDANQEDWSLYIANGKAYQNVGDTETSVYLSLDKRFFDLENVTMTLEVRQYAEGGYILAGEKTYSAEELQTLARTASETTETAYIFESVQIPITEELIVGYNAYCVVQFNIPSWIDAKGAPMYRWAYTGAETQIFAAGVELPDAMVWLYNLDADSYRGALVRSILEELDIAAGTVDNSNLGQRIGAMIQWPGYDPVEDPYSAKDYDVEYMLMANLTEVQLDKLLDAMQDHNIRVNLKSVPTAWTAAKTFEELFEIMADEDETLKAAIALDKMIYDAEALDEEIYGSSPAWADFQKALADAIVALETDAEEDPEGANLYINARKTLLEAYLKVTDKQSLTGDLVITPEKAQDDRYTLSASLSDKDATFSYSWAVGQDVASTEPTLTVDAADVYKVKLTITGTESCYGQLTASLSVPGELKHQVASSPDSISVAFTKYKTKANTPEPITYVAELYQNGTKIQTLSNETGDTLTFPGLEAKTEYTVQVYATNLVGRTDYAKTSLVTANITVDGKTTNGIYDFDTLDLNDKTLFPNGADDAYLVTIDGETRLLGDTSLKNWVGNWETWQPWIYPDAAMQTRYPYLERVWNTAFPAYIKAFEGTFLEETIKNQYKTVDDLKNYWYEMTDTKDVARIKVAESDTGYRLTWLDADGKTLAEDSYTMTGKIINGLEGSLMYVFTADTLEAGSPYQYLVSMVPDMEGNAEKPIARHYHFQFGSDLTAILARGQQENGLAYDTAGKKVSDLVDKYWYATMIDSDATDVAKYNVILGMHMAEKWSKLPSSGGGSSSSSKPVTKPEVPEETPDTGSFLDVSANDWFAPDVAYAVEKGLMNGTSETKFSPNDTTTRAMLMTILARLSGEDTTGGDPWYEKGMAWAKENGISDGTAPDGAITREQLATMLWRYAGSPVATGSLEGFTDGSQASDYAATALAWAVEKGILNGMSETTLAPQGTAIRAQVAAMLHRFCTLMEL